MSMTDGDGRSLSSALPRNMPAAFGAGAIIGALGGLIGLGGAEFRLPLLARFVSRRCKR